MGRVSSSPSSKKHQLPPEMNVSLLILSKLQPPSSDYSQLWYLISFEHHDGEMERTDQKVPRMELVIYCPIEEKSETSCPLAKQIIHKVSIPILPRHQPKPPADVFTQVMPKCQLSSLLNTSLPVQPKLQQPPPAKVSVPFLQIFARPAHYRAASQQGWMDWRPQCWTYHPTWWSAGKSQSWSSTTSGSMSPIQ